MSHKIGMVSLGCPKNQVDAERMLAELKSAGFEITNEEEKADVIIVNTCGFIESAKTESIENIIEVAAYKKDGNLKALVVTGCLAERYKEQIISEIPEVDCVVGIGSNKDIVSLINEALSGKTLSKFDEKTNLSLTGDRILTTPFYSAYLKVAEGCNNRCSYCAIPDIRGNFRSLPMEECVAEAEKLAKNGVKELIVVAQDTTNYGADIYGKPSLAKLLKELCKVEGIRWIRTLYTYPDKITDELLRLIASEPKLVPYLDIPIQHASDKILKKMNRRGSSAEIETLILKIREKIPGVTLRTSLITGFPGETEEDFTLLAEFVNRVKFDRLGCFPYSAEEDTPAAGFENQIDPQIRQDRSEIIMNDQMLIAEGKNEEKIGSTALVLVEGYDSYIKCFYGRSAADAPDIDGKVFFMSKESLKVGSFVNVLINDVIEYDLLGEFLEVVE
ncbi:MAG: 30S ribosomal protein S12 methylthiotransferase RimO [Acutalibacteraceae bacterium]|nr:30S ribosomal protein S12 methylthiotransferase RimO [Acutalibacteraceae bacterium]